MDRSSNGTAVVVAEVVTAFNTALPPRDQLVRAWTASYRPSTRRNYGFILADFFAFCDRGGVHFTDIRRSIVEAWGQTLAEERMNVPSSVAHKLSAVRSFYAWLTDEQFIDKNPTSNMRRARASTTTSPAPTCRSSR